MKLTKIAVVFAGLVLAGCAGNAVAVPGYLYASVRNPIEGVGEAKDMKTGKATCESILGWIATGDCSVEAAKRAGGITKVQYVDQEAKNILSVYCTYTTVVKGE
jgi:hypothetical protein